MSQLAQVNIEVTLGTPARPPASVAAELVAATSDPKKALNALWRFFNAIAGWLIAAVVRVRVDAITDYAARLALAVTQANLAAGEKIHVVVPGRGTYTLTAVAAVADSEGGEFISQTSNTVTAAAIATAINAMRGLKDLVTASADTGTLTIVSKLPGEYGNTIRILDGTANALTPAGGLLAGGLAAYNQATSTVALTFASISAADTLTIGGKVFTWQVGAAAGDGQVTIGANLAAACTNLAAAINAHTQLAGLATAVATATGVTITYTMPVRTAKLVVVSTSDAVAMVVTQPTSNLTVASQQATTEYVCGA